MTFDSLIDSLRSQVIAAERSHPARVAVDRVTMACIAGGGRAPSPNEAEQVRAAKALIDADPTIVSLRSKLANAEAERDQDAADVAMSRRSTSTGAGLPSYDHVGRVGYEQRTYNPDSARGVGTERRTGSVSFFSDAYKAEVRGDLGARQRIERHAAEVEREGEMSERAASTGSFAGLIIPQYLIDLAALTLRAGRPFANTCQPMPLPEQGMVFQIPRGTTGTSVTIQATENTSVSSTDEVWANLSLNVATAAGQQNVSRQSLERGTSVDELVFMDLAGAYAVALDQQVLSGSGASGQVLGVLNTAGISQATSYTAAASLQTFYSKVNGSIATIAGTRFLNPTHLALAPRRASWLANQFDTAGRPVVVPSDQAPMNAAGTDVGLEYGEGGRILKLSTVTDANIPTAVGAASEDIAIAYRAPDLLLFEDGDGMPRQLRFEQTLGNQLSVTLVAYQYFAFTAGRYPQAVAVIGGNSTSGNGQVTPVF